MTLQSGILSCWNALLLSKCYLEINEPKIALLRKKETKHLCFVWREPAAHLRWDGRNSSTHSHVLTTLKSKDPT